MRLIGWRQMWLDLGKMEVSSDGKHPKLYKLDMRSSVTVSFSSSSDENSFVSYN